VVKKKNGYFWQPLLSAVRKTAENKKLFIFGGFPGRIALFLAAFLGRQK
jgi:hypothetical protein